MFTFTTIPEPAINGLIVRLSGAATGGAGSQLQMRLTFIVTDHPRAVVLDLSELEIISSLNIGELVSFRKAIMAGPPEYPPGTPYGQVAIAGASPLIHKTLTFSRLDSLFQIFPDVASAVEALKAPVNET
jgi:hypothetical protein